MDSGRLLAVDPSLTCSGWALFSLRDQRLLGVGKVKSLPAALSRALRLKDVQTKVQSIYNKLDFGEGDVLVCEAATTMRDPRAAMIVEQVRGIFETLARARGANVPGRLNPRSVHYEVLGLKGKQLERRAIKEMAVNVVQKLYAESLARLNFDTDRNSLSGHQDVVDAILVGSLALSRINSASLSSVDLEDLFEERKFNQRFKSKIAEL